MKWIISIFLTLATLSTAHCEETKYINYLPPDGIVKDEKMALTLAEIVLISVYGSELIKKELPLKAKLINGKIWLVSGSFNAPADSFGGVAEIRIRKKDGAVLGMIHGK